MQSEKFADVLTFEFESFEDYFGKDSPFFQSALWLIFHSMLAFKPYHSALEAQRYLQRFSLCNRIDYDEGILHTKRNEYDSVILPIMDWLNEHGVHIVYNSSVTDLDMDPGCEVVTGIHVITDGKASVISTTENDLVFVTNGSMTTNSTFGDNTHVAVTNRSIEDLGCFGLWQNLARKHEKFGHPEKFLGQIDKTKWMSVFVTVKDYPEFFERMEILTGSRSGTGGIITIGDSSWDISLVIYDRDYYVDQRANNADVMWVYGLFGERNGDFIRKPMCDCTGNEIMTELLYHLNLMEMKDDILSHSYISTCMMPYITAHFMPRTGKDRPKVIPDGCRNLAFMGQYVEVAGDVSFTVETSVRTPLEAVYGLTNLEKDYIELFPSKYDNRYQNERIKKFSGVKQGQPYTVDNLPEVSLKDLIHLKETMAARVNSTPPYYIMYPGKDKSIALSESVLNPKYPKDGTR